jgi:hypothetical protein
MDLYNLSIHVIHISCGLFWGGAALMLHFFIMPAIKNAGPDGSKMMQAIMSTRKLPIVLLTFAFITIGAGLLLMEHISGGYQASWFGSKMGITLSIGGTTGILAMLVGLFVNKPAADKIAGIATAISESGNPPSAEQVATLGAMRSRIMNGLGIIAWLIIITIVCMASAHYI